MIHPTVPEVGRFRGQIGGDTELMIRTRGTMFYMRVRRVEEAYERGERNMEQSREILEIEGRNDTLTDTSN